MRRFYILIISIIHFALAAQVQDFRLMSYNLMYYKAPSAPCPVNVSDPAKDANFKIVFKAINPHILCVNELGAYADNSAAASILSNVINTDGVNRYTSAGYTNNSFSSITNMLFYDSTLFALESQTFISKTLDNTTLDRVVDFYRLYYKDPGLSLGADTTFLTIVVAHLKAGNSSAYALEREKIIEAVMDYLTNNVSDDNVILSGDMNLYGSTEGAYQEMINYSVAAERFNDPTIAGSWNNNSLYASIHTQSTHSSQSGCFSGGGLDDRFDFILYSNSIKNGSQKLSYKTGSFTTFGNDGAHFNQSINSGTNGAVSQQVANALYNFSDHLPIYADFEITPSGIGIQEIRLEKYFSCNNPFNNELWIRKAPDASGTYTLTFTDLRGTPVFEKILNSTNDQLKINTSQWSRGVYLLTVTNDQGVVFTKKLVK